MSDDVYWYRMKRGLFVAFVVMLLVCLYIVTKCEKVEAAEVEQEETTTIVQEDVGADEELLLFGYLTEPEEQAVTLARIYNVLLTILYVMLINIGRQIIIRNLRKGQLKHGLAE